MNPYEHRTQQSTGFQPNWRGPCDPIVALLYDQKGMLHDIKAKTDRVPAIENQVRENTLNIAVLRARFLSPTPFSILKENWTWMLAALLLGLQIVGLPQHADTIRSAVSPIVDK